MKKEPLFLLVFLLSSCNFTFGFNSISKDNNSISEEPNSSILDSQIPTSTFEDHSNTSLDSSISLPSETPSVSTSMTSSAPNSVSSSVVDEYKNELLQNVEFNTLSSWTLYPNDISKASVVSQGNKTISLKVNNSNATENWSVQFLQSDINLTENNQYKISFEITSSATRSIQFLLQSMDYGYLPCQEVLNLTANKKYTFIQEIAVNQNTSYLYGFMLGNVNGTLADNHVITISNVSLRSKNKAVVEVSGEGKNGTYYAAPQTMKNRSLVWSDEFNGTELDTSKWGYELGNSGWGNNEYQYYTNRKENAYCSNGSLKIVARKERYSNSEYTSARLITKGKYEFTYGYVETRIALPSMTGIWPAFWLLGTNYSWPYCGEIDVVEAINSESKVYSTLHWNNGSIETAYNHAEHGNGGVYINDRTAYHVYGLEWTETNIRTYLDGELVFDMDITGNNGIEAFRKDFYFLFNVAVGGNWPGFNIANNFPQAMSVDYIRVYK